MEFSRRMHGGGRAVKIRAANADRVIYDVDGYTEGNVPVRASNCCMTRKGFEQRFKILLPEAV